MGLGIKLRQNPAFTWFQIMLIYFVALYLIVRGSFDIFSRNDYSVKQGTLQMIIHPPIYPAEYEQIPTKQLMQQVHDIINSGLVEKYKK